MASSDLGSLMRSIQSAGLAGGLLLPWCSGGTPGMDCSAAQHASGRCIPGQAQEEKIIACSIRSWSSQVCARPAAKDFRCAALLSLQAGRGWTAAQHRETAVS